MTKRPGDNILRLGKNLTIRFERTLRIPDDGRSYPLPPTLGAFPLRRVEDYAGRVPDMWRKHGGVFLPMYQREAMWLSFSDGLREPQIPHALKVGVGNVCAITGDPWCDDLHADPQDYVVTPPQPWLDGISIGEGMIRQFVAMPLGMGYTIEGQITGEEVHGGLQLLAFPPKPGRIKPRRRNRSFGSSSDLQPSCVSLCESSEMGLAAGGCMDQNIYPDPHGVDVWDKKRGDRAFVHIVNTAVWREITGEAPPATPVTAREYERAGLPWFALYDERLGTTRGSRLRDVKSVKQVDAELGTRAQQDDESVEVGSVRTCGGWGPDSTAVRPDETTSRKP